MGRGPPHRRGLGARRLPLVDRRVDLGRRVRGSLRHALLEIVAEVEVELGAGVLLGVDLRVDAPDHRHGLVRALELGDAPRPVRLAAVRLLDLVGLFAQLELELALAFAVELAPVRKVLRREALIHGVRAREKTPRTTTRTTAPAPPPPLLLPRAGRRRIRCTVLRLPRTDDEGSPSRSCPALAALSRRPSRGAAPPAGTRPQPGDRRLARPEPPWSTEPRRRGNPIRGDAPSRLGRGASPRRHRRLERASP